ncbi:hypothetical protein [Streptodolium elevatio]|uniref:Uncharacterized protein n=1 Tax=Streptodolium elevatio TaxID=3157996 RepID=A0ABV3DH09_9ACTN
MTEALAQPIVSAKPKSTSESQPQIRTEPQPQAQTRSLSQSQAQSPTRPQHPTQVRPQVRPPARPVGRPAVRCTTHAAVRPAGAAPVKRAARSRGGTSAAAELDDQLALAATTGQCLVAVSRALRMALRAVESWRADPGRAGCLCRAAEEIRVAIALIEGVTPPRLRRGAVWTGPVEEVVRYPVSTVARLLGRTVRVMRGLAQGGATPSSSGPSQGTAAVTLDATARTQCRTAWEHAFHSLVRLRAVQEAATWFPDSPVDPWLLLAAEAPFRLDCPQCDRLRRRRRSTASGDGDEHVGAKIIPFPQRPGPRSSGTNHVC